MNDAIAGEDRERTHLSPDSLGQLAQVLRRGLGMVCVRRVAVDLRMRGVGRADMMRKHARGGRGLLMLCHEACCDQCARNAISARR